MMWWFWSPSTWWLMMLWLLLHRRHPYMAPKWKSSVSDTTQSKSGGFDSCDWPSNLTQTGFKSSIFQPVWPWNLMMTLKNNRAPLLYYVKLCASFQIHQWIQTGVTVRKFSIPVKTGDFLSCVTLKFDGWPRKTIGHLFYTMLSFVPHFKAIGEFKLELQSRNAVWTLNLTDDLEKQ